MIQKLSYSDIEVRLGAYNLTVENEENVVLKNVIDIVVHPDWDVNKDEYDADVAILVLNDSVSFTKYVEPVSLPDYGVVVDSNNINISGTIVGWGVGENQIQEETPRQAEIRAIGDGHCYRTYRVEGILALSSERTFCAGSVHGNPSRGDSGGGFFVYTDGACRQYGIISSITTDSNGSVVRSLVAVYSNVQLFEGWIKNATGMMIINLLCEYNLFYGSR